jgi:NADPH:quinone reductase-like Zn-dependent oxidoreductase
MKAVGLTKYLPINNPESLVDLQVATPEPSDRDLLVRVEAISVNPVDTKIRAPKSDVEREPRILGWDAAGTVEATGPAAKLFRLGDAATTPARLAGRVPTASFIWSMNESPDGSPRISLLLKRLACP